MRTARIISTVESHTEGMPTRVVVGGVGVLPGSTMEERRQRFMADQDGLHTLLMTEPRGHSAMSGAILQPPCHPDADFGVLYIEVSGCLSMCGHGTIGVATVLVETGMVPAIEPVTVIRLDTPAGLVTARVHVSEGHATAITIRNVPSFVQALDQEVSVPELGMVTYDLAFGGNFYAIVRLDQIGVPFDRVRSAEMLDAGLRIMDAINATNRPEHPEQPSINTCHHVYLQAPGSTARHSRYAMAIYPGWFDRSPCGTGTSARMAQLHARGELPLQTPFVNESLISTTFTGMLVGRTMVGDLPAVIPEITGRAWVTGTAQWMLDPTDPFPAGFTV